MSIIYLAFFSKATLKYVLWKALYKVNANWIKCNYFEDTSVYYNSKIT